ncbi:MAG TPA: phosphate signaling complex protein PhoU [Candidatus Dormibacteraeota bacterium]|nr:phosphate signaling complex protein PhoU [Candidatus Dormibacteraeota bacterium]
MAPTPAGSQTVYQTALENYLVSMARAVERSINMALDALLARDEKKASSVFLLEPRINEMEIVIDDHAVRMLRGGQLGQEEVRHIVATLKVNNDLERIADLAVNLGQRVIALSQMSPVEPPAELEPMSVSVRSMVGRSLGALIYRNLTLAHKVLENEEVVDTFRDQAFERLMGAIRTDASLVGPYVQFLLATRDLERIADHTTNIAEDVVFWLRGLDIRHGRIKNPEAPVPSPSGEEL